MDAIACWSVIVHAIVQHFHVGEPLLLREAVRQEYGVRADDPRPDGEVRSHRELCRGMIEVTDHRSTRETRITLQVSGPRIHQVPDARVVDRSFTVVSRFWWNMASV